MNRHRRSGAKRSRRRSQMREPMRILPQQPSMSRSPGHRKPISARATPRSSTAITTRWRELPKPWQLRRRFRQGTSPSPPRYPLPTRSADRSRLHHRIFFPNFFTQAACDYFISQHTRIRPIGPAYIQASNISKNCGYNRNDFDMERNIGFKERRYIEELRILTRSTALDCVIDDRFDRVIYVIRQGDMGLAIGKKGDNIKRLQNVLGRRIEMVEYAEQPDVFIANIFKP